MDNLVSLLKSAVIINVHVRQKILELIQSWATAAEGRHELSYLVTVYDSLKREGFQFPPKTSVASSMIDSSVVCRITPRFLIAPN